MAKMSRRVASGRRGTTGRAVETAGTRRPGLFTAAEQKLLAESQGTALEKASRAVVHDRLKRVRGLRDKWRDLLGRQVRKEKRSPQALAEANARSREKAEQLQSAVTRLEQRLARFEAAPTTSASARRTVKKSSRVATHRATRAGVRAAMAKKTATLNLSRPPRAAAARPESAAKKGAESAAVAVASDRPLGTRRRTRPPVTAASGVAQRSIRPDRAKQRSARAGAAHARLAIKGVSTRRSGHVLASGKRAQARRDKRSR